MGAVVSPCVRSHSVFVASWSHDYKFYLRQNQSIASSGSRFWDSIQRIKAENERGPRAQWDD